MNDTIKYIVGGSLTAIFLYLVLNNGTASVNLVNGVFSGATGYAKALQGR